MKLSQATLISTALMMTTPALSSSFDLDLNLDLSADLPKENPLYPYAHNANGKLLEKFEINFDTLSRYYEYVAPDLFQNSSASFLRTKTPRLSPMSANDLTFKVNLRKMTFASKDDLTPESVQSLFQFDTEEFIKKYQGRDFSEAQVNYFKQRSFDPKTQYYERTYLHLSDWKSLIHPPIRDVGETVAEQDRYFQSFRGAPQASKMFTADFNRKIDLISRSELTHGNKLKILVNQESFFEKLKRVKAAKKSVYVAVMSFAADPSSFEMVDALIAKSKEGLDVQVILEKFFTTTIFHKTLERFAAGGVKMIEADDYFKWSGKKRTVFHNKLWIFDDEAAIVGGQNILNSSNNSTGFNHWNKDTDVLIEGPMVTDVIAGFTAVKERFDRPKSEKRTARLNLNRGRDAKTLKEMIAARKASEVAQGLRGSDRYESWLGSETSRLDGNCRFVIQGPQTSNTLIAKTYIEYFQAAQKELFLTSQHIEYDPDEVNEPDAPLAEEMFHALFGAASAGVRIDLLANGIDGGFAEIGQNIAKGRDNSKREARRQAHFDRQIARGKEPTTFIMRSSEWLGLRAAKEYGGYLQDTIRYPNFNAWMHFQYIHTKAVLIDNAMASIGSFNFEHYSAEASHESAIFCYDQKLVGELKKDLIRDMVNSTPVLPQMSALTKR